MNLMIVLVLAWCTVINAHQQYYVNAKAVKNARRAKEPMVASNSNNYLLEEAATGDAHVDYVETEPYFKHYEIEKKHFKSGEDIGFLLVVAAIAIFLGFVS